VPQFKGRILLVDDGNYYSVSQAAKILRVSPGRIRQMLLSELPLKRVLGTSPAYTLIPVRYRGVGKRACSANCREEFFSEIELPV